MGSLYLVECHTCDYCDEVAEGSGMAGALLEPMECGSCRRVVAVQTSPPLEPWAQESSATQLNACPHCGSTDVAPWGNFADGSETPGRCPQCEGPTKLDPVGIWD